MSSEYLRSNLQADLPTDGRKGIVVHINSGTVQFFVQLELWVCITRILSWLNNYFKQLFDSCSELMQMIVSNPPPNRVVTFRVSTGFNENDVLDEQNLTGFAQLSLTDWNYQESWQIE